jgi:sulfite reductase alpha subunit-like flavoprotein
MSSRLLSPYIKLRTRTAASAVASTQDSFSARHTHSSMPKSEAKPLTIEFTSDGPMLLIGVGVGIAPFQGFVRRRLKSANCANKVWVLQGVRGSLVDELYWGEWGVHEDEVKRVVESRREGRYVQDEVRARAQVACLMAWKRH